jgi:hypothetical protein
MVVGGHGLKPCRPEPIKTRFWPLRDLSQLAKSANEGPSEWVFLRIPNVTFTPRFDFRNGLKINTPINAVPRSTKLPYQGLQMKIPTDHQLGP